MAISADQWLCYKKMNTKLQRDLNEEFDKQAESALLLVIWLACQ